MNPESNADADLRITERTIRPGFGDFFNRLKWVAYVMNSDTCASTNLMYKFG
jgi:hypothetical protein